MVVASLTSYISRSNSIMVRSLAGNSALAHEVDTRFDTSIKFALRHVAIDP